MELETLLVAALQSSFLLGLLHGVNPCGHSWLVLAPFVTAEKIGKRVTLLTVAFLSGTALACLFLGATLGTISQLTPPSLGSWIETGTSIILIIIGGLLLYKPDLLHHHDHDLEHERGHNKDHLHPEHSHVHCDSHSHSDHDSGLTAKIKSLTKNRKTVPLALFGIGFVNMIIPCPTVAVMYGYALNSGSAAEATLVFGTYAISTAIAVGGVIYLIFKATNMAHSLQKEWVEPFIMRLAGAIIIIFSGYGLYQSYTFPG